MQMKFVFLLSLASAWAATAVSGASFESSEAQGDERRVTIAYINDLHAQLEPHPELFWSEGEEEYVREAGGVARIATVVNQLRAERPGQVLFIDGGDTIQGSGPAAWTEGRVMVEPMNALGLDLAIPGNWSVAYGAQAWRARAAEFNYPMVAANMLDAESGEPLFPSYLIREVNGVRLGIIGFTEPEIGTRQPPHLSEGLAFQAQEVLQPLVDELRGEELVDAVILVSHIGLPKAVALTDRLKGVDIHLSSDTHDRTYEPIIRGDAWVVEAGSFGSFVGVMEFSVATDGALADRSWRLVELRPELFPEDPEVKAIVEDALAPHRSRMNRVIGSTDVWLARYEVVNSGIDNLIAPAIREATGADIALSNGFRFAPPTAPGPITVGDLWTWLPLKLELKTGLASGEQLADYWETELENAFAEDPDRMFGGWLPRCSGLTVDFWREAPPGERLEKLAVGGQLLDREEIFTIAAGHREGAPEDSVHRVRGCDFTRTVGLATHEAVERFLALHSPIRDAGTPNVRCLDCPGILRSQYLDRVDSAEAGIAGGGAGELEPEREVIGPMREGPVKVVFQITGERMQEGVHKDLLTLKNLHASYVKAGMDPDDLHLSAVIHGAAADHVLTDEAWNAHRDENGGNPNSDLLAELAEAGVSVELCDQRRIINGWEKSEVHPDVLLVSNAYQRLIDLQSRGYAYIKL